MSASYASTHEGEAAMFKALIEGGLTLHLFANDVRPGRGSTARSFVEADFPGYAPAPLPPAAWTLTVGAGRAATRAAAAPHTFTRAAAGEPVDVYGWYLTTKSGAVVMAVRFDRAPWDMTRAHDAIKVVPAMVMPDGD